MFHYAFKSNPPFHKIILFLSLALPNFTYKMNHISSPKSQNLCSSMASPQNSPKCKHLRTRTQWLSCHRGTCHGEFATTPTNTNCWLQNLGVTPKLVFPGFLEPVIIMEFPIFFRGVEHGSYSIYSSNTSPYEIPTSDAPPLKPACHHLRRITKDTIEISEDFPSLESVPYLFLLGPLELVVENVKMMLIFNRLFFRARNAKMLLVLHLLKAIC